MTVFYKKIYWAQIIKQQMLFVLNLEKKHGMFTYHKRFAWNETETMAIKSGKNLVFSNITNSFSNT